LADAMEELYNIGFKDFEGCVPKIKFIRKINLLIYVMNSRTAYRSITSDKESHEQKVVIL